MMTLMACGRCFSSDAAAERFLNTSIYVLPYFSTDKIIIGKIFANFSFASENLN